MTTLETISTVIAAVAAILGGVWFILGKVFKMGVTAARIDNIEGSMTELKDSLKDFPCSSHHDDSTRIKALLLEKYPKSASVFSCKCSPRRLNETGEKLFRAVDGEKFINENKTALFKLISDSRPLVELDVEQAAVAACLALAGTPAFCTNIVQTPVPTPIANCGQKRHPATTSAPAIGYIIVGTFKPTIVK